MGALISPAELAAALDGPEPPVLLDVRWQVATGPDRAGFDAGHLPAKYRPR